MYTFATNIEETTNALLGLALKSKEVLPDLSNSGRKFLLEWTASLVHECQAEIDNKQTLLPKTYISFLSKNKDLNVFVELISHLTVLGYEKRAEFVEQAHEYGMAEYIHNLSEDVLIKIKYILYKKLKQDEFAFYSFPDFKDYYHNYGSNRNYSSYLGSFCKWFFLNIKKDPRVVQLESSVYKLGEASKELPLKISIRLQEIRNRLVEATEGDWEHDKTNSAGDFCIYAKGSGKGVVGSSEWIWLSDANAKFIANSKSDVQFLLDEIENLAKQLEEQ